MGRYFGIFTLIIALLLVCAVLWQRNRQVVNASTSVIAAVSDLSSIILIEQIQYRSTNDFDPGTVQILLRNPNKFPIRLTQITWDDLRLSAFGVDLDWSRMPPRSAATDKTFADKSVAVGHVGYDQTKSNSVRLASAPDDLYRIAYWTRVEPGGEIDPGNVAMVTIKLTETPTRRSRFSIFGLTQKDQLEPQVLTSCFIDPIQTPLFIERVAFTENGERVFIYIANADSKPCTIKSVEVNGLSCNAGLWLPQKNVPVGGHTVVGYTPPEPFIRGDFVTVRIVADRDGAIAQVRAVWGFPVGVENGSPATEWQLDQTTLVWRPDFLASAFDDLPAPDHSIHTPGGINAMSCVICGLGQLNTVHDTAQEMLRRYEVSRSVLPGVPVIINPCRVSPEKGYALFASTADALMINPAVNTSLTHLKSRFSTSDSNNEAAIATVAHLAHVGRMASAPGLYYPLLSTSPLFSSDSNITTITSEEFRARLFTLLAEGADGLFYRHDWPGTKTKKPALNETILAANKEIETLSPWLSIGGAKGVARVEGVTNLTASSRLAGDQGILVFLVRKNTNALQSGNVADANSYDDREHTDQDHDHDGDQQPANKSLSTVTNENELKVHVFVPLPEWAKPAGIFQARPEGLVTVEMTLDDGGVAFTADIPAGGAGYIVTFDTIKR